MIRWILRPVNESKMHVHLLSNTSTVGMWMECKNAVKDAISKQVAVR